MRQTCRFVAGAKANAEFALIEAKLNASQVGQESLHNPSGDFRREQLQKDVYRPSVVSLLRISTIGNSITYMELHAQKLVVGLLQSPGQWFRGPE